MPNYHAENWQDLWNNWLKPFNLQILIFDYHKSTPQPSGYSILSGTSPRGDWLHAVVMQDGTIVHDPHPDKTGVTKWVDVTIFIVLDPAKPVDLGDRCDSGRDTRADHRCQAGR